MINFRRLKQDFSPSVLKEGRVIHEKGHVLSSKILSLKPQSVRLICQVQGNFQKVHKCEIEIDRMQSTAVVSECNCSHKYDCQHLSAVIFHLEEKFDEIVVNYSKEADIDNAKMDDKSKAALIETFKMAKHKEKARQSKKQQTELLQEYLGAAKVLAQSPFFMPEEKPQVDKADLAILFSITNGTSSLRMIEFQLALRMPYRSKPLQIPNIKSYIEAVRYNEPLYIAGKRYFFNADSFDPNHWSLLKILMDVVHFADPKDEKRFHLAQMDLEHFGVVLSKAFEFVSTATNTVVRSSEMDTENNVLPCLYFSSLEEPLKYSNQPARLRVGLEYLEAPAPKVLLKPTLVLNNSKEIGLEDAFLFECANPGLIHDNTFHVFMPQIKRKHLHDITRLRDITIPDPLFGTFVENSLPELQLYADVTQRNAIDKFVTMPFVGQLQGECEISYLNGELEATLHFLYDKIRVPAASSQINLEHILPFVTNDGILSRHLTEEQKIVETLFQDFTFDMAQGIFSTKSDKKIVEFMTETIPQYQHMIKFNCPENLLEQFIYDNTTFILHLKESSRIDLYDAELEVKGHLNGTSMEALWECLSSKRPFIEISKRKTGKKKSEDNRSQKILVLDLQKLGPVLHIFDEIGIKELTTHTSQRPLWSLANIEKAIFKGLPVTFSMSEKLKGIQDQMLGVSPFNAKAVPKDIKATLRSYQLEGVHWLERLRYMHLSGILADDMGLGKTLQAIIAMSQFKQEQQKQVSLIICPTSLVHNWKEEFAKFNPKLKVLPVDGTPTQRKKLLNDIKEFDAIITSYSLLQKDIDFYKTIQFGYAILDEAQHIKNRTTRNAKSVKMIQAMHKLILTGTPIENSLDELWSLFDFLMPGLLSSYDRFVEKYIRNPTANKDGKMETLRKKVSPFILRRMKKDVLDDLPPVSHILYHCHMTDTQRDLYHSYAASAREELAQLVKKEGFDKVQIHVLATLTRLKQICCHPAIFAKDKIETGDSAKYEMLMELLQTLIEGKHKTVIFSQYTKMLNIIREDLQQQRIHFEYLDGTSKNRLEIVKKFNDDPNIPVFLVSLKAGGSGLNLVGADTVIHYDMWWNPAVENQATDRIHRIGQKNSVSSYKLVTLNTVEEKIIELQNRKSSLVTQLVSSDEETMSKLTWEEVLELLQT